MEQKKQEATVADNCKGIDLSRREMLIGAGAWMAGAAVSQLGLVTPAQAARTNGAGRLLGWGLTCGAPVAGALVIGLAVPKEYSDAMIHDLLRGCAG